MNTIILEWESYCRDKIAGIDICLHAKKRMRMRAWEELKDLTRSELIDLIKSGRLLERLCGQEPVSFFVEIRIASSKIGLVIKPDINQLATVYNAHYHYDPDDLEGLTVREQVRVRREAKQYHQELESLYAEGKFRGRKFKF
jgi:hypothetical protein